MAPRFWEMQLQKKEERLVRSVRQVGTLTSGAPGTRLSQITNDSNQGANARSMNPSPNAGSFHNANDEGQLTSKRKFKDENIRNSNDNVSLGINPYAEGSSANPVHLDSENGSNTSGSLTIFNQEIYGGNNIRNVRSRSSSPGRLAAHAAPPQSTQSVGFSSLSPVHPLVSETNFDANTQISHTWGSSFPYYYGLSTAEIPRNTAAMDGMIVSPFVFSSLSPALFSDDPWLMSSSGINSQGSNNASFYNHQSLPISDSEPSHHPLTFSGISPVPLPAYPPLPIPASAVYDQVSHILNHFENGTIGETWHMPMTDPAYPFQIDPVSGTNGQGNTRIRGGVSTQRQDRGRDMVNYLQIPDAGNNQNMSEDMGVLDDSSEVEFETDDDALRDMRLDVDNMSYEELLELGEQIGNVNIGLTEKAAKKRMKLRKFVPRKKETEPCCICQDEYKKGDKLGILKTCGHTFHPDCIKQWLMVKDSCPICKTATSSTSK